jgi:hypothetical protein|uniref:J domain-containing protein n=1 Tax=viral metagenome TaxID=1070528 RepID=A0A6C0M086_9ZZZZ
MPLPGKPTYQTKEKVDSKLPDEVLRKAAAERAIFDAELKKKQEKETAEAQAKLAAEAQANAKSTNARHVKPRPLSAHASAFATLKIHPSSTISEIRKAYLKLAMETHPDKNKMPKATTEFQKIQAAYETLINPQKNGGSKRRICRMYRKTKKTHRRTKHCRKT